MCKLPAAILLSLAAGVLPRAGAAELLRGDANADTIVDLSDAVFILIELFLPP